MRARAGLAIAVSCWLWGPSAALAADPPGWVLAIRDCASNGRLDGQYTHADLRRALEELPSDGDEYTDCASVLRAAYEGGSGRPDLPAPVAPIVTDSGAVAASADDVAALQTVVAAADRGGAAGPIRIADREVDPAPVALGGGIRHWNDLPAPLAACLVALAMLAAWRILIRWREAT
jgi:hypothetical protein